MTATFRKKVRRQRGSHTHGWGAKKKHRGSGSRGGHGQSGMFFQKRSYVTTYDRDRFGRTGFVMRSGPGKLAAINLGWLDQYAAKNKHTSVDVSKLGFDKVLGGGRLTQPLTIKAKFITESAAAKIKKAGGKIEAQSPKSPATSANAKEEK